MAATARWAYIYTGERWEQLDPQYNAFLLEYEQEAVEMHHQFGYDPWAHSRISETTLINGREAHYTVVVRIYDARITLREIVFEETGTQCQLTWDYEENADTSMWRAGEYTRGKMTQSLMLVLARIRGARARGN